MTKARMALALIHHPCVNKAGEVYTTSITNLDVHDIARSSATYGLDAYYIVTPISAQKDLANAIATFWESGARGIKVPTRAQALKLVKVVHSVEDAIAAEEKILGARPLVTATSAKPLENSLSYADAREKFENDPSLLLFGTGFGLAKAALDHATVRLPPVGSEHAYNHLSVRSAVAVILDRLRGI